jgi:hypothetical protein
MVVVERAAATTVVGAEAVGTATLVGEVAGQRVAVAACASLMQGASTVVVVVEGASLLPLPLVSVEAVVRSAEPALPGTSAMEVSEGAVDASCWAVVGRS